MHFLRMRCYMRVPGYNTRRVRHLSRLRARAHVCRVKHETEIPVRSTRTRCCSHTIKPHAIHSYERFHIFIYMHGRVTHLYERACIGRRKRASNNEAYASNTGNIKSPFNIFTRAGENDEVSCFLIMYPRAPEPRNSRLRAALFPSGKAGCLPLFTSYPIVLLLPVTFASSLSQLRCPRLLLVLLFLDDRFLSSLGPLRRQSFSVLSSKPLLTYMHPPLLAPAGVIVSFVLLLVPPNSSRFPFGFNEAAITVRIPPTVSFSPLRVQLLLPLCS